MRLSSINHRQRCRLYLWLSIAGFILPYLVLTPFLAAYGLDWQHFFAQAFANSISGFLSANAFLSTLALIAFILFDSHDRQLPHRWTPIVATLLIGVACGLPLYLYLRERHHLHMDEGQP